MGDYQSVNYSEVIELARRVSRRRDWANSITPKEAFEVAYDAMLAYALSGKSWNSTFLYHLGKRAIRRHLWHRGASHVRSAQNDPTAARDKRMTGDRFCRYWLGEHGLQADDTADVVEQVAVAQALAGLTAQERDDLLALAETFNGGEAAKKRGVTRQTFVGRCRKARVAFFEFWFEDETPPAQPKRVVNGRAA